MTLTVPDAGPCARHRCDACRVCQSGRCCRRDNPDYRLPKLGEWGGPIHAPLGAVVSDDNGDTVRCHACGASYKGIALHAWFIHDLTAGEYKAVFGIPFKTPISSTRTRARFSESAHENIQRGRIDLDAMRERSMVALTQEQQSENGERGNTRRAELRKARGLPPITRPPCSVCSIREALPHRQTCSDQCAEQARRRFREIRRCSRCQLDLPASDFDQKVDRTAPTGLKGYRPYCRDCGPPPGVSDAVRADIKRRRQQGVSARTLAREYGVSPTHVYRICRESNP